MDTFLNTSIFLTKVVHVGFVVIMCCLCGMIFILRMLRKDDMMCCIIYMSLVGIWIGSNIIFNGCPLTYLQEWLEVKAGLREAISYTSEGSVLYGIFHEFVKALFS